MFAGRDFAIPIAAVATLSQICRFGGWESSFVPPSPELLHCSVLARCHKVQRKARQRSVFREVKLFRTKSCSPHTMCAGSDGDGGGRVAAFQEDHRNL
ncbi:hypothetical protein HZH66_000858 [Vespula vulgaris]|uniref:Uncharacterized protein n=1 Tax=Vespula vulgaris TaxID=7454 RepID=A0A834NJR4_VESVU|nr:hypothetical protein HZH66_000858 [Vespula vulgaris]